MSQLKVTDNWNAGKNRQLDGNDLVSVREGQGKGKETQVEFFLSDERFSQFGSPASRLILLQSKSNSFVTREGKTIKNGLTPSEKTKESVAVAQSNWKNQHKDQAKKAIPGETKFSDPLREETIKSPSSKLFKHESMQFDFGSTELPIGYDQSKAENFSKGVKTKIDQFAEKNGWSSDDVLTFMESIAPHQGKVIRSVYEKGALPLSSSGTRLMSGTVEFYFPTSRAKEVLTGTSKEEVKF